MITPKTKKLSRKKQYSAKDKNGVCYTPLFEDEVFFQVPRITFLYVSQYARFIRTYKNASPRLLSPYYQPDQGYTNLAITIPKRINGKKAERTSYGVHDLVSQVWCEKPDFLPEGEPMETHHLIKVKKNLQQQSIDINFAENLKIVYARYHKLVESIRSIKVSTYSGSWKSVKNIGMAADYNNMEVAEMYKLLSGKPTYIIDTLEYYEIDDSKSIEVRKFKLKSKKKKK